MADKKFLALEKQFDEDGNISVMLSLDTDLIRKGMLKNLKPTELKVLLALASHMDDNGEAFPSLRYISEITGVAVNTVSTAVKGLLALRIDGLPIMTRKIEGKGARKKSKYNFVVDTDNPVVDEELVEKRMTPKQIILLYCEEYEKEFGYQYKVQWMKDTVQIKNMMKNYSDEEIKDIIHIVVTEYKKRWAKPQYPAPTIGGMAGWLSIQAMQINSNKTKKQSSKWDNLENTDEDLML
ncbi:TPA: helix-turn-helix domain-containing protein [Clostridium botulinum]